MNTPEQINDGGPAFPNLGYNADKNYNGMSLRDWFAGQALAGMLAAKDKSFCVEDIWIFADRIIASREVKP